MENNRILMSQLITRIKDCCPRRGEYNWSHADEKVFKRNIVEMTLIQHKNLNRKANRNI